MANDWQMVKRVCRNRAVAYGILVLGMMTALAVVGKRANDKLHHDAVLDCHRANAVAANQRLVLRTLIADRKDAPGYLLYGHPAAREKSIRELHEALHAVPIYDCK